MRKEFIIIITILILIIISHIVTQNYTKNFFDDISKELQKIEDKVLNANIDGDSLKNDINIVQEKWEENYDVCACYIEHDELEKVQTQLVGIKANIETKEYDKCVEKIESCKFVLKHIEDKDSFELVNIF